MKIYSDTLTREDLERCANLVPAVYLNAAELVDGRKRRFERVTIRAHTHLRPPGWTSSKPATMGGRREMPQHATYDEHGRWMAALFNVDHAARIVSAINTFDGRDDFHSQTKGRYAQHSSAWGRVA